MYNVYKIVNSVNNKVYVGRTVGTLQHRWSQGHMKCLANGDTRHIYSAMRKYGVDKFHIELIEECASYDDMIKKEAYYCELYDAYNNGYNMTTAGEVNPMDCDKSRKSHDEKMRSEDVRTRISKTMKKVRAESKNTLLIHKGTIGKRIDPKDLDKYLSEGYEIGSNETGKIRIHRVADGRENSVWDFELDQYLNDGWELGGKPDRISEDHRKVLDKSHFKKVQGILLDGSLTQVFENLKDATTWWFNYITKNNIDITNYLKKRSYSLADYIKKSATKNVYIYNVKWIYLSKEKGDDENEKVT